MMSGDQITDVAKAIGAIGTFCAALLAYLGSLKNNKQAKDYRQESASEHAAVMNDTTETRTLADAVARKADVIVEATNGNLARLNEELAATRKENQELRERLREGASPRAKKTEPKVNQKPRKVL